MLDTVLTTMFRYNMLRPGDRVIAAVSGGADSVCLLHVLCEVAPGLDATVTGVAHLNHKLRGEASDEDERFVAALAARPGCRFIAMRRGSADRQGNLEQDGRRARLKFFARLMREGKAIASRRAIRGTIRRRRCCFVCCAARGWRGWPGFSP